MIEQILQADRLLQVDQVTKARELYGRVVELDPGNAIAVVGLARCALAEGDDGQAYQLASRALEIDPENDMARRMEARLSEILATRGEPVRRPEVAATPASRDLRPVVAEGAAAIAPGSESVAPMSGAPTPTTRERAPGRDDRAPGRATEPAEPAVRKTLLDRLLGR